MAAVVRLDLQFRESVIDAIEPKIVTPLQRFNIFRRYRIDPFRNLCTVLLYEGVDARCEGTQNSINVWIDLDASFDHRFVSLKQALEVVSAPTIIRPSNCRSL